jgi:SET family sugar efflux transporter-like MFS transporter
MRRLFPIAFVYLTVGLSTAMSAPFLTLFLTQAVRASAVQVAVYLVAAPAAAVIVSTVIARWSDRLPSRRWLLAGTALAGVAGAAVTALVRDYRVLLLAAVTVTAAATATLPQVFAYAREALNGSGRVAVTMGSLRALFAIAWVAGPTLAAVLLGIGGFTLVYAGASVMYAATAVVALAGLRAPRARPDGADGGPAGGTDAPRTVLVRTLAAFVLGRCSMVLVIQGLPLFVLNEAGGSVRDAGLLLGLCAGLEIPVLLGFGALAGRVSLRALLIAGTAGGLAYAALVAVSSGLWPLVLGQVFNAVAIASVNGIGILYVQDMLPRHPGRASTFVSNTFPAGGIIAGPILGAAQHAGYRTPYVAAVVLSAAAVGLLAAGRRGSAGPA